MNKPHLATDLDLSKWKGPGWYFPKLDGVRALHLNGSFSGRSLKPHGNKNLTAFFDRPIFSSLDGELTIGDITDGSTCRRTTSAVSTINGPQGSEFVWHIFDDLTFPDDPYRERYKRASERVSELNNAGFNNVQMVPFVLVNTADEIVEAHLKTVAMGYEGSVVRDPSAQHKDGRCTVREGAFLRLKDFSEAEAVVLSIEEGLSNNNEAKVNLLGYTERSSHKDNKVPNGMVGRLICRDCISGATIVVAPGCLTHQEREDYFKNPGKIIGKVITYKTMPYGKKDLPRFPTFQRIRPQFDIS